MEEESSAPKLTRRELMIGAIGLAAGIVATKKLEEAAPRYFPTAPEAEDVASYGIYDDPLVVYSGVNFRTSPGIPDKTKLRQPANTIAWENIAAVNQVPIKGSAFVVEGAEIVKGQATRKTVALYLIQPSGDRIPASYRMEDETWVKLRVQQKGKAYYEPVYVNLYGSRPYLAPITYDARIVTAGSGVWINYEDRGQIWLPSSPGRAARDIAPSLWSKKISAKLDGKTPLRPGTQYTTEDTGDLGERIIASAQIVAAGASWAEKTTMEQAGTQINVRNYPEKTYANSEPVEVVGVVAQGTEIKQLLVDSSSNWTACRRENIVGELYDAKRNPITINPKQIVAINDLYLKY